AQDCRLPLLKQTIPLPGVEGRIDHLDLDISGKRLFVCALGNNTVEVIDLNKGERVHTISGLGAPQGVAFVPELNRLLVANDKGGACNIYDANSFQLIGKVDFADDADNVRYDNTSKRIYVGFGSGGIGIINEVDGKQVGSIKLAAHPEAFELEKQGHRVYVTCGTGKIDIIDQTDANTYKALAKINTADGARSGLFVPERDALFVAVPHRGSQQAEIRRYQIE